MNNIKYMSSFKTVYSENKTFLVFSVGKREEINYSQVQMLENDMYREYFVPFQCTKTSNTNKISFDISGLTSLSEYLKSDMTQEQYFEIISGIQKIISFCKEAYFSYDNLVCNPKYMYYHNIQKRILMAYVPLKNPHYICDSIPACLSKIHKSVKNLMITDGNYMNRYESYLDRFANTSGSKKNPDHFSPDSLLHFFNENSYTDILNETSERLTEKTEKKEEHKPSGYSISQQIAPAVDYVPEKSRAAEKPSYSATVVRSRSSNAYLTDEAGNRYDIFDTPFTIGRNSGKHLVVEKPTVSGNHAEISEKNGVYHIEDYSSNGTYLNDKDNRIEKSPLSDGDKLYFDSYCYVFHIDKPEAPAENSTHTVMVSRRHRSESGTASGTEVQSGQKVKAYLKKVSDNKMIGIQSYPFSDSAVPGITIFTRSVSGKTGIFIKNDSCSSLELENINIPENSEMEIFSGCSLVISGDKYMFNVEN